MAASRFDTRNALIQEEVNAIGTTYLRAQLLPVPQRRQPSELLQVYVASRIKFLRAGMDNGLIETANGEASRISMQLWTLTRAMIAQSSANGPKELFIQSLNDAINVH